MEMHSMNCPSCGGKIEFQASAYLPGKCTYCGASIAPVKDQEFSGTVKLSEEKKEIKIPALPSLENQAKKKGLPLSKLLLVLTLIVAVSGVMAWRNASEFTGYWKQWETN